MSEEFSKRSRQILPRVKTKGNRPGEVLRRLFDVDLFDSGSGQGGAGDGGGGLKTDEGRGMCLRLTFIYASVPKVPI